MTLWPDDYCEIMLSLLTYHQDFFMSRLAMTADHGTTEIEELSETTKHNGQYESCNISSNTSKTSKFMDLPTEIHTLVADHLTYPDLLSLIHSHPQFFHHAYIRTSKIARIDWLIQRAYNHLPLPIMSRCWLSDDREFVDNAEVRRFIRRRRRHLECAEVYLKGKSSGCCFVIEGRSCPLLAENMKKLKREQDGKPWKIDLFRARILPVSSSWRLLDLFMACWWTGAIMLGVLSVVVLGLLQSLAYR